LPLDNRRVDADNSSVERPSENKAGVKNAEELSDEEIVVIDIMPVFAMDDPYVGRPYLIHAVHLHNETGHGAFIAPAAYIGSTNKITEVGLHLLNIQAVCYPPHELYH